MGVPAAGSVVVIPFPFSDLSNAKRRPAVVLADAGKGDAILCMVTSNAYSDTSAMVLSPTDLSSGVLHQVSYVRPNKRFTAHETLMDPPFGKLTPPVFDRLRDAVVKVIRT
jgi:mRNA interferase MazF